MKEFEYSVTESGRLLRSNEAVGYEEFSKGRWGRISRPLFGAEIMDSLVVSEEKAREYMDKLGKSN